VNKNELAKVKNFLNSNRLAALSTVSTHHTPHVSFVYYMYDNAKTLYVAIPKDSHNATNIAVHPDVSLAIGKEEARETVLIDAHASFIVKDGDRSEILLDMYKTLREIKDGSFSWPLLKLHGTDIEIVKITVEHFRYWVFDETTLMFEGRGSELAKGDK
jgi:general stress protein 26